MSRKQDELDLQGLKIIIKRITQLLAKLEKEPVTPESQQGITKCRHDLAFAQNWANRLTKKLEKRMVK